MFCSAMYFAIPHLTTQRRPTVLRYPHQVQMNLEPSQTVTVILERQLPSNALDKVVLCIDRRRRSAIEVKRYIESHHHLTTEKSYTWTICIFSSPRSLRRIKA